MFEGLNLFSGSSELRPQRRDLGHPARGMLTDPEESAQDVGVADENNVIDRSCVRDDDYPARLSSREESLNIPAIVSRSCPRYSIEQSR